MALQATPQALTIGSPARGWLLPLEDAPDPAFASGALGEGVTIELLGELVLAPCAGRVVSLASSRHAVTIETHTGAQLLIHCGIDTVALDGAPFEVMVQEGQEVAAGDPLLKVDLEAVVAAGKSLSTPVILIEASGHTLSVVTPSSRLVETGVPLFQLVRCEDCDDRETASEKTTHSQTIALPLPHGLHARPAAAIAAEAARWEGPVRIGCGGNSANARSVTELMKLGAQHGASLHIATGGRDADDALAAMVALITAGAGDTVAPVPSTTSPSDKPVLLQRAPATNATGEGNLLPGVAAAPGEALGPAYYVTRARLDISEASQGAHAERERLNGALAQLRSALAESDGDGGDAASSGVRAAHRAILGDPALLESVTQQVDSGKSAATAWQSVMSAEAASLRALPDARLAERADDFADLEQQLLRILIGSTADLSAPQGSIVIASDLYPSDLAPLARAGIAGIATMAGGATSHLAILAASAGIPMVVALGKALCEVEEGDTIHLDGDGGTLRHQLENHEQDEIARRVERRAATYAEALAEAHRDTFLASGERIEVFANLGSLADAEEAVSLGAEGSGLLRTEFLFLDRPTPPGEGEQTDIYRTIMDRFDGKPVIIRTLDIGADKPAPYLPLDAEDNPALGVRGVRISERYPELLETQLRAIIGAAGERACHIMAPMVTSQDEIASLRKVADAVARELGHLAPVKLGAMVETPACALLAADLVGQLDFLSVGTNDLTQYTLAMDRTNPELAALLDPMHPAVLRLIAMTGEAASAARCDLGVCGNAAGDATAAPVLVGLGATELSVSAARIPEIKRQLRGLTLDQCRAAAQAAIAQASPAAARAAANEARTAGGQE